MRARCFSGDIGLHAIGVDDEDAFGATRIAGLVIVFDRFCGAAVHELHGGRHHAVGDDGGNAFAGRHHGGKGRHERARYRRLAQDLHHNFDNHAQQAFAAGDQAQQVEPALRAGLAAHGDDLAPRKHQRHAEQVVGGEAIFEAMQAAAVFRDIAADGAGDLAGRIGGVIEALRLHGLGDVEVGDAGFDHDAAILIVDLENPLHPAHADQDAVLARQGAARQGGSGTARNDGHALGGRKFQDFADLIAIGGQHADQRHLVIGAQRIGIEGGEARGIGHHAIGHDGQKPRDDLGAAGNNGGIGGRKKHARPAEDWRSMA
jgi:hypothetical protein